MILPHQQHQDSYSVLQGCSWEGEKVHNSYSTKVYAFSQTPKIKQFTAQVYVYSMSL